MNIQDAGPSLGQTRARPAGWSPGVISFIQGRSCPRRPPHPAGRRISWQPLSHTLALPSVSQLPHPLCHRPSLHLSVKGDASSIHLLLPALVQNPPRAPVCAGHCAEGQEGLGQRDPPGASSLVGKTATDRTMIPTRISVRTVLPPGRGTMWPGEKAPGQARLP